MLLRGSGNILNVASVAGFQPSPLMAVYNATKAYILSFTEAIANEVRGTGVAVTVLCPGLTRTDFQQTVGGDPGFTRSHWLSSSAEDVARYGLRAMQKGKVVAVPGLFNQLLANAYRFLPRRVVTQLVRRVQEKNRAGLRRSAKPLVF
jgi:short-subunit dehydrogenase